VLIGYARTSTSDQVAGLEAQERDLTAQGCERIWQEQTSALGARKGLEEAIAFARAGDTLVVTKICRLARSVANLVEIIERLEKKGVTLRICLWALTQVTHRAPDAQSLGVDQPVRTRNNVGASKGGRRESQGGREIQRTSADGESQERSNS